MKQIFKQIEDKKLKVHAVTIRYKFSYYSPYNTTDNIGFCHFFKSLMQFYNKLIATNYFNIEQILSNSFNICRRRRYYGEDYTG